MADEGGEETMKRHAEIFRRNSVHNDDDDEVTIVRVTRMDIKQHRDVILQSLRNQFATKVRTVVTIMYDLLPVGSPELDKFLLDIANNVAQATYEEDK